MQSAMVFMTKTAGSKFKKRRGNCGDLISQNLLESRAELIESSLRNYESAEEYPHYSNEAVEKRINGVFESRIADAIAELKEIPSLTEIRIIKQRGFLGRRFFTPECNYCNKNMTGIEAEITIETEKEKQRGNVKLFYFCDNCGFVGIIKNGF